MIEEKLIRYYDEVEEDDFGSPWDVGDMSVLAIRRKAIDLFARGLNRYCPQSYYVRIGSALVNLAEDVHKFNKIVMFVHDKEEEQRTLKLIERRYARQKKELDAYARKMHKH